MIKIKVKTENNRTIKIPIPYAFLNAGTMILTSERLWKHINKLVEKKMEKKEFQFPTIDRKMIKPLLKQLLKELKQYKGIVIVDVKAKDGTEVVVKL